MKTAVVTGATSGIGFVTARELARQGYRVIVVGRDERRISDAVARIGENAAGERADFARLDDVRALGQRLVARDRIDVLVNNAGVVCAARELTHDGLEMTFAVNHLAPFLLTGLLRDALVRTAAAHGEARVVTVASAVHKSGALRFDDLQSARRYAAFGAYATSKLANILFTRELARRLSGTGVTANALHPGTVATNFGRNNNAVVALAFRVGQAFMMSADDGARTSVYLASSPEVRGVTGKYFVKCKEVAPHARALDDEVARRLWDESANLTGLA